MIMIPFFLFFLIFPEVCGDTISRIVAVILFALTSLTDMLDGKIARKYNIVSDFGKFLDPLADKLLVLGAMLSLVLFMGFGKTGANLFGILVTFATFIVLLRELAVTSLRLICKNTGGAVIAANMAGKIKTVSQIIFILAAFIEPIIFAESGSLVITYISLAVMVFMTVYSGINYFIIYLPLMKNKD
jgi:CDP-diacylglycerol--glycerol-3-phosphate 3-phosphatidyltransferase